MRDVTTIVDAVEPVVAALGLELYDVEVTGTGRALVVRVLVDREGGDRPRHRRYRGARPSRPSLDDDEVARALPGAYALEVSSPGLERPLRRPDALPARGRLHDLGQARGEVGAMDVGGASSRPTTRPSSWRSTTARTNESPTTDVAQARPSSSGGPAEQGSRRKWHGDELRDDGGAREHRAREGHLDRDHARGARERARHRVQAHARRRRGGAGRDRHRDRRHQGDRAGARRGGQGRHASGTTRPTTSVASPRRPPSR